MPSITKSKGHIQPSIHDSPELTAMWQSLAEAKKKLFGNERIETINRLTAAIRKAWIERGGNLESLPADGGVVGDGAFFTFNGGNSFRIEIDPVKAIGSNLSAILGMLREHKPEDLNEMRSHFEVIESEMRMIVAYWAMFVDPSGKVENAESN